MIVFAMVAGECNWHNRARNILSHPLGARRNPCSRDKLFSMRAKARRGRLLLGVLALAAGLACHSKAPHSVTLTWQASKPAAGASVVGYNIYRRTKADVRYTRIAERVQNPPYVDRQVVSGQTYVYSVTAVDQSGRESRLSENIQAVIP
jgi:hypothetical protein